MRIACTGHTQGIGKAVFQQLQGKGHDVMGFSKSTGFDIVDPVARQRLIIAVDGASLDQQMFYVEAACAAMDAVCVHLPLFDQAFDFRPRYLFDFENRGNYLDWCRHRRFSEMPGHHYGQDAHQNLARLLNEYVRVIYADK